LPQTRWHMAVVFPEDELFAGLHRLYFYTIFIGIVGIILLSLVVILFSSRITKPLRRLTAIAEKIGEGNFDVDIREDRSTKEIFMLGSALSRMQAELKDYIKNLESTTAAKERFESELNIAHDIQQGMIPKIFPPFPDRKDVDIYALLVPARQVGGDFYDFFFLDDENLCFAIGDVSDKGVPASLMMAMTITLFRAKTDLDHEIHELVNSINNDISKDNVNMMFITFFMGILNLRTGKMKYCNAGHNYPMLIKHKSTAQFLSETHGIPLGISENFDYRSGEMNLERGDTLVLYTDGITEALSITGEFYGDDRFADLIRNKCLEMTPLKVCGTIMEDVESFTKNPERSDDITLLVLSYFPPEKQ
ncbi:MAG: SpoIIE family protein phosphatase, partial [Bacteroidales bacterium]|nr:SpoIIE family protein phosphatase [Bacteroidales bacterium]